MPPPPPSDTSRDARSARQWIDDFAQRLGVEAPDDTTMDQLLDLAGVAAHASERKAAPIACWMASRWMAADPTHDAAAALRLAQET